MEENKIISKIKKILAKAGSTDSPAEAEALFVKAQKLMLQHRISESKLQEEDSQFIVEANQVLCFARKLEGDWEKKLARVIAKANCCDFVYSRYRSKHIDTTEMNYITFYGQPQDVQLVKYFFETTREAFRQLARKDAHMNCTGNKNTYIRSFLVGACHGLGSKITKMTADHVQETGESNYPVLVANQLQKVNQFMKDNVSFTTKTARSFTAGDMNAYSSGVEKGKKHSMSMPIETTSSGFTGKHLK